MDNNTPTIPDTGGPPPEYEAAMTELEGKLTVLSGADKNEVELTPAGDNRLDAKGVKLAAGAKAVAVVTLPTKRVVTVRFTAK